MFCFDHVVAEIRVHLIISYVCVDFCKGRKPEHLCLKHRRDRLRELSNMKCHTTLSEGHNALTACATRGRH